MIVSVLVVAVAAVANAQMLTPFGFGGPRGPLRPTFGGPAFGGPAGPGGFGFGFDGQMGPNGGMPNFLQIPQQAMSMVEFLNNFMASMNQQRPGPFNQNMDPSQMFQNSQQMVPGMNQNPSDLINNMLNPEQPGGLMPQPSDKSPTQTIPQPPQQTPSSA